MRNYFNRTDAISCDVAKERTFKTHGTRISLIEFSGSHHKSLFVCNICGNKWHADTWSIWRGNGCPQCYALTRSINQRLEVKNVNWFIESNSCKMISSNYTNNRTPITIRFECGHIGDISFTSFRRGSRCKICGLEKFKSSRKYSMDKIYEIMEENNLKFIEFPNGYINRSSIIEYSCGYGHKNSTSFRSFLKSKKCYVCSKIDLVKKFGGENSSNWQGGKSSLKSFLGKQIIQWKKDSAKNSRYECVLCKEKHRFDHIHHLYNFLSIVDDSLSELNLDKRNSISKYSSEELLLITNKVLDIHARYPLGVALCWEHHKLFHKHYGNKKNTPEQFEEFKLRIESGDIRLPD